MYVFNPLEIYKFKYFVTENLTYLKSGQETDIRCSTYEIHTQDGEDIDFFFYGEI